MVDATFGDLYELQRRRSNVKMRQGLHSMYYNQILSALSTEFLINEPEINLSDTDPERVALLDKYIDLYNKKYPDRPLPTTNDVAQYIEWEYFSPKEGINYEGLDKTGLEKLAFKGKKLAAGIVSGTVNDFSNHPITSVAAIVALPMASSYILGRVGLAGWRGYLAYVAAEGMLGAAATTISTYDQRQIEELVQAEQKSEYLQNAIPGFLLGAGFSAAIRGAGPAVRALKGKEAFPAAELATPEARADAVFALKSARPSSMLTPEATQLLSGDLAEFEAALSRGDRDAITEIFSRERIANIPKFEGGNEIHEAARDILATKKSFDSFSLLGENETIESVINGVKNERFKGLLSGGKYQSVDEFVDQFGEQLAREYRSIEASRLSGRAPDPADYTEGGVINELTKVITKPYPTLRKYNPAALDSISSDLRVLLVNRPTELKLSKIVSGNVNANDLHRMTPKKREATIKILRTLHIAKDSEAMLQTLSQRIETFGPDRTAGVASTIRNFRNTQATSADVEFSNRSSSLVNDVMASVRKEKGHGATLSNLNSEALADALLGLPSDGHLLERSVAHKVQRFVDESADKLIAKGFDIKAMDNYLPNAWDIEKLSSVNQSSFRETMLELLDFKKMEEIANNKGRPIKDRRAFLDKMYNNIKADRSPRLSRNQSGDLVSTGDRILVFKDGASWARAHQLYGRYEHASEAINMIISSYRKLNLKTIAGFNTPNEVLKYNKSLFQGMKALAAEKGAPAKTIQALTTLSKEFENVFMEINGFGLNTGHAPVLIQMGANIFRKAMLTQAWVTATLTDLFGSASVLTNTIGSSSLVYRKLQLQIAKMSNKQLRQLIGVTQYISREEAFMLKDTMVVGTARKVLNTPNYFLGGSARHTETVSKVLFTHELANKARSTWNNLPKRLRNFLASNGVTAKEWEVYRKLPKYNIGHDTHILSANYLRNMGILKDSALYRKFATIENIATFYGSPKSTLFGNQARAKSFYGYANFRANMRDPFANISQSMWMYQYHAVRDLVLQGEYSAATRAVAGVLFGGFTTVIAKDLLAGRKTDFKDPKTYIRALMYSNIAGIFVDDLLSALLGFHTAELPSEIIGKLARGEKVNWYKAGTRAVSTFNPLNNFFLIGAIAQNYTTDRLFRLLDPAGAAKYDVQLYKQLQKGRIYRWRYDVLKNPKGKL